MTRDEVVKVAERLGHLYLWEEEEREKYLNAILRNDAEQRAEIERLRAVIEEALAHHIEQESLWRNDWDDTGAQYHCERAARFRAALEVKP